MNGWRDGGPLRNGSLLLDGGPLRYWSLGLLGTAIAVVVCYLWLDRPIAHLAHDHIQQYRLFEKITLIPEGLVPLAAVVFVIVGLRGLIKRRLTRFQTVLLLSGVSLAAAVAIKNLLKYAFGRPWPETWTHNNPSLIRDNVFGFFPFHGGYGYESFPSGHMTAICTVMTVLWICYPRYRPVYGLCMAAVAIGLVGANFHFLSDVIAGGFLGISVGWLGVALWEMGERRMRAKTPSESTGP
jgi:membrane-associated phospholipid phosphatase